MLWGRAPLTFAPAPVCGYTFKPGYRDIHVVPMLFCKSAGALSRLRWSSSIDARGVQQMRALLAPAAPLSSRRRGRGAVRAARAHRRRGGRRRPAAGCTGIHFSRRRDCDFDDTPFFSSVETPGKGREGCSRMTVSPTANPYPTITPGALQASTPRHQH